MSISERESTANAAIILLTGAGATKALPYSDSCISFVVMALRQARKVRTPRRDFRLFCFWFAFVFSFRVALDCVVAPGQLGEFFRIEQGIIGLLAPEQQFGKQYLLNSIVVRFAGEVVKLVGVFLEVVKLDGWWSMISIISLPYICAFKSAIARGLPGGTAVNAPYRVGTVSKQVEDELVTPVTDGPTGEVRALVMRGVLGTEGLAPGNVLAPHKLAKRSAGQVVRRLNPSCRADGGQNIDS